ncbi:MAG: hypothetical protein DRG78_17835 [Epsilonproteobacteria bacterium]|nr:MAG: hypothetical protein DRG78_17835 [Campylobacterota bacterium]
MIRYPLIVLLLSTQLLSQEKKYGYSFLAAGMQSSIYTQNFDTTGKDYTLKSDITSPYYITGNLTRINARYGFEIIAASTLFANSSTEKVHSGNETIQHNVEMTLTDISLILHYKPINEYHRATFGFKYSYEVQKRYNFEQENLKEIGIIENKIASMSLNAGYLYTSKILTGTPGWHYRAGVSLGIPVYAVTADTYPPESFEMGTTWGYMGNLNGYIGYTVYEGLELGFYTDYLYRVRFDEVRYEDAAGNTINSSDSITNRFNYGLMASWSY